MAKKRIVVGDIHTNIKLFENAFIKKGNETEIVQLGDIARKSNDFESIVTFLYFWNLAHNNFNHPKIIHIKGNHENVRFVRKNHFFKKEKDKIVFELDLTPHHQKLKEMDLEWYDENLKVPSAQELFEWIDSFEQIKVDSHFIYVHGWYNPQWALEQHKMMNEITFDYLVKERDGWKIRREWNGLDWGSPAKIYRAYQTFCLENNLEVDGEKSKQIWSQRSDRWYFGYENIEKYNETIRNKTGRVLVVGHWFDIFNKGIFEPSIFSNLICLDTGVGYGGMEHKNHSFFDIPKETKIWYLDNTIPKKMKICCYDWENDLTIEKDLVLKEHTYQSNGKKIN